MDTSEQYIKMCERVPKIQEGHEWEDGDSVTSVTDDAVYVYCDQCDAEYGGLTDPIWLLRQDQLQAMVREWLRESGGHTDISDVVLLAILSTWVKDNARQLMDVSLNKGTFEQLWLAFIMKEKYGKVWDGENWEE